MEVFKVAMYTNQNVIQLGEFMKCHSGYQRGASKLIVKDKPRSNDSEGNTYNETTFRCQWHRIKDDLSDIERMMSTDRSVLMIKAYHSYATEGLCSFRC